MPPDSAGHSHEAVLKFWFGSAPLVPRDDLWWGGRENDAEIQSRFGQYVDDALQGKLDHWRDGPRPALALILLLDQMTRNIFRGTAQAFAGDAAALATTRKGLSAGYLDHLHPLEAVFFLMPLEHHESLASLDLVIDQMQRLANNAEPALQDGLKSAVRFAHDHREIIAKFGRYPHRNKALGRDNTAQEAAWLAAGGRRFGQ